MDALLLAIFNALWQGAALIAIVALALRFGLRRNATTACMVWSAAFVVVAVLPLLDLALERPATALPVPIFIIKAAPHSAARTFAEPLRAARPGGEFRLVRVPALPVRRSAQDELRAASAAGAQRLRDAAMQLGGLATTFSNTWGPLLAAAWSLIVAVLLLRLALAYAAVVRVKRAATPLEDPLIAARLRAAGHFRRATVASSPDIQIPCAIGFRRPMILIPAGLVASLDADDLARVVLHESAHLQRYDDCINALEQIVCALQFFQPALFLARRRIDFEREVACDDRVLEDSGEPLRYAECLARIVQRHVHGRQAAVVPGFILRRAQVVARVRRIVDKSRDASPHLRFGAVAVGGALLATTLGLARLQVPLVAPASATPAAAPPAVATPHPHAHRAQHAVIVTMPKVRTVTNVRVVKLRGFTRIEVGPTSMHLKVRTLTETDPLPAVIVVRAPHVAPLVVKQSSALPEIEIENLTKHVATLVRVQRLSDAESRRASLTQVRAAVAAAHATAAEAGAAMVVVGWDSPGPRRSTGAPSRDDDLLAAIDDAKYPHPSVDGLIALKNGGVSASYVRAMGALGSGRPALDELPKLYEQGVSAVYLSTVERQLATPPTIEQVIALRQQGVSAAWLDALASSGYPKLTVDDAATLAQQGVPASYVRGLMEVGLRTVTPAQLIELRNAGVDAAFVRRVYAHGYSNFGVDELVRLRQSGLQL
jgi:beta-lactamase regulating signal transducer with metallopeptidase domain